MTDYAREPDRFEERSGLEPVRRPGAVEQALEQVDRALVEMIGAIGDLDGEHGLLAERLSPVLRPQEARPTFGDGASVSAVPACELAGNILERAARIEDLANRLRADARTVQDLRERLEV